MRLPVAGVCTVKQTSVRETAQGVELPFGVTEREGRSFSQRLPFFCCVPSSSNTLLLPSDRQLEGLGVLQLTPYAQPPSTASHATITVRQF